MKTASRDRKCAAPRPRGFTLIEVAVVGAVVAVLGTLAVTSLNQASDLRARTYASNSLFATLSSARERALARQRTQIVVLGIEPDSMGLFGFYSFEDTAVTPNIFTTAQVTSIVEAITPPDLTGLPMGMSLSLIDSHVFKESPFLVSDDAWSGIPIPFPWTPVETEGEVNTEEGCTFCVDQLGAVAFLPNGRAIFSGANPALGMVVMGLSSDPSKKASAIGVNRLGFVQRIDR